MEKGLAGQVIAGFVIAFWVLHDHLGLSGIDGTIETVLLAYVIVLIGGKHIPKLLLFLDRMKLGRG